MNRVVIVKQLLIVILIACFLSVAAQQQQKITPRFTNVIQPVSFRGVASFVEQVGQYQTSAAFEQMGTIQAGYEGFNMPVLFTSKGILFLQKKQTPLTHQEEERLEKLGMSEEAIEQKRETRNRTISMEWVDANATAEIQLLDKTSDYHTYGRLPHKAYGYSRLLYKNMYPGIDILYSLKPGTESGFEYSLVVKPGGDISKVKMKYGGDVKKLQQTRNGNLLVRSDIDSIFQGGLTSFTTNDETGWAVAELNEKEEAITTIFEIANNEITFKLKGDYDHNKILVIDPFVTSTGNLDGTNVGKAKDVDFDYDGNIYVTGGGDGTNHRLSKFSATGVLQWTFSGSLLNQAWSFGPYFGGWVVDKTNGNIYLGQGFAPGFRVARISTLGVYDNYITVANPSFMENWKMIWRCNNGVPQILIAGGGINSNINLGILAPPSTSITSSNITGIPYTGSGFAQDIADLVIDPVTNEMYSIFASLIGTPVLNNKVYKHFAPYTPATIAWSISSGFNSLSEAANRPYMGGGFSENSINSLAINSSYIYYWDGVNLKAINKATGADVGTPFFINTSVNLMSGGIVANECNTIFIGSQNGTIKVLQFNGTSFNDAAFADISIPGFTGKPVYDVVYDEGRKLLYASGDGFVASLDAAAYACANTSYTLQVTPDCLTSSATAVLVPNPPAGFTKSFSLYQGINLIESNSTGSFSNLLPNTSYTVKAFVNQVCSGVQTIVDFTMPNPSLSFTSISPTCGTSNGSITASGAGGTAPYAFSLDNTNFSGSNAFSNLTGGVYPLSVKDAGGCITKLNVNLLNANGPEVAATSTNALCGINNGTITASASGNSPFLYSTNGVDYSSSNLFAGLPAGAYTLSVKDAAGCTNNKLMNLTSIGGATILAVPTHATCNRTNGIITMQATGGSTPLLYSVDGINYGSSPVFANLAAGTYAVSVKDANNCINDTTITILNNPGPGVTAAVTAASCNNINGTISLTVSGGTAPYQYSLDGNVFQSIGFFSALAAGSYNIKVQDATACATSLPVTLTSVGAPQLTAATTSSSCASSTGTITVNATGGLAPLQYSINGTIYQASNVFSALAPGNYSVYVRDASGCINITTAALSALAGPTVAASLTVAGCTNADGAILVSSATGTAPFQYKINAGAFQAGNNFTGLSTGNYLITIKDANNCTATSSVTIVSSIGLQLVNSAIFASCNSNNGIITATASGGAAPLTYSINGVNFQSPNQFTSLPPATYTVTAKDANGCKITAPATVAIINSPQITAIATNTSCNGSNGTIIATVSNGTAPYNYSIDGVNFQEANTFKSIASGSYIVTLKDANNCTATANVSISNAGAGPGPTLALTVRNTACGNNDGRVIFDANGGRKPYSFFINGAPDNGSNSNHLPPGVYDVMVVDRDGCSATASIAIGDDPAATLSATTTTTLCNASTGSITITTAGGTAPFSYSLDGVNFQLTNVFNDLGAGAYNIIVQDANGCISTKLVQVLNSNGPTVTAIKTDAYCSSNNGTITTSGTGTGTLTYSIDNINFQVSNSFPNLLAGSYIITVQDGNGCKNTTQVLLGNVAAPLVTPLIAAASCNSNNGSITLNASGGLPPYQYSNDGTIFQTVNTFTNLAPATYTVVVMDANNCFTRLNVTVTKQDVPSVTAFATPTTCQTNSGALLVATTNGLAPYQYSLNGTVFQSATSFSNLSSGLYNVYVKDANGCINQTRINVPLINGVTLSATPVSAGCSNSNGSITLTASGGTAPFTYSIDGANFQSPNIFTGLTPGLYPVAIKDASNCIVASTVPIARVDKPVVTAAAAPASCNVGNGQISAIGSGGLAPLQYSINSTTFQASNVFSSLVNADYQLIVSDANGCRDTSLVTVGNFTSPQITAAAAASCGSPGILIAEATGGSGLLSYSIDGSNYFGSGTFNNVAGGSYTVTVKDANGCTDNTAVTVTVSPANPKTWFGVNTDWQDPVNWCGGVPAISNDVVIPAGLSNYPDINNGTAFSRDLTIEAGASVTVSAKIQVLRNIVNNGVLDALAGTVELNGTDQQSIAGSLFLKHTVNHLIISNTSAAGVSVSATPGDTLKISKKLSFGFSNAVLNTGDQITLLSSDTATASLGEIIENADGSPKITINGHMIVERYYPRKRAWRMITAPVKNDAAAPSINVAWQEAANPSVTGVSNANPHLGYGTHITGPFNAGTAFTTAVTDSGFDQSPQNNSSIKFYEKLSSSFQPVSSTYTTKVTDRQGFLLFVRGSRSYSISTTTNFTSPSATVLRVEGNVNCGMIQIPADTGLQVIGNPYPSTIRFDEAMFANNSGILKNQSFWLWDPLKGSAKNSPANTGGWVPVVYTGNGIYISTYNPSVSVAGLDSAHAFEIDGTIQSGAAFMIDNKTTATGNFVIHESSKVDGSNNHLFRPGNNSMVYLMTNLFRTDENRVPLYWTDGVAVLFNDTYKNETDFDEDIRKVYSSGENLSIVNNNEKLAIERRTNYQPGDTLWLDAARLKAGNYKCELYFKMNSVPDIEAFFEDSFTGTQTRVSFINHTLVDIEVTDAPASFASNRFRIVFKSLPVPPLSIVDFKATQEDRTAALQWQVVNQFNLPVYTVETASSNSKFTPVTSIAAVNSTDGKAVYHSADEQPVAGINYYRIKVVEPTGVTWYSDTVVISMQSVTTYVQVYPNPVQDGKIQLLLHGMEKGRYQYQLFTASAQLLHTGNLLHPGGKHTYIIQPANKLLSGHYQLVLTNALNNKTVFKIAVE